MMEPAAILVVEDEPLLRLVAVDFLREQGYAVFEAGTADGALRVMEEHCEISVVFTDVNMPGSMDGLELADTIHKRWPPVHLIVTSGKLILRDRDLPDSGRFIPKPYTSDQVLSTVDELAHAP